MIGLEPITCWLQISCSANWATSAYAITEMTPTGIEPVLPPWKGDVLTAWPRSLILLSFGTAAPLFFFCSSSPSRARTCNNSVNSRVLYHWAIEDYVFSRFFVLLLGDKASSHFVGPSLSQIIPSKPNTEIFLHIFCKLFWLSLIFHCLLDRFIFVFD